MSNLARLLKKPFFGRFQKPFVWPSSVPEREWARVELTTEHGNTLVGIHARARGAARGIAVLPHPMVSEAKAWGLTSGHADFLRDCGFDVLAFDFNGFGESENAGFDFPADVRAAGRRAASLCPGKPVVLFGLSLGAGHGLSAMDCAQNPFQLAVLEGAFTSLEEFWAHFFFPHLVLRTLKVFSSREVVRMVTPILRAPDVRGLQRVLFIYGDRDRLTPPSMGERFVAALATPADKKSLWVVPGAKHLGALQTAGEAYRERVRAFLHEA